MAHAWGRIPSSWSKKRVLGVFVDFHRVFAKVWKHGLYHKLLQIGINPLLVPLQKGVLYNSELDRTGMA